MIGNRERQFKVRPATAARSSKLRSGFPGPTCYHGQEIKVQDRVSVSGFEKWGRTKRSILNKEDNF